MCNVRLIFAILVATMTIMGPAFAVEFKQAINVTDANQNQPGMLSTSLMVSHQTKPLTTQDDIAKQLLGPHFISPIAENLAK